MMGRQVAIFRPDDHRTQNSTEVLEEMGYEVLSDPLLEPGPTGEDPLPNPDWLVLTSVSGVELTFDDVNAANAADTDRTRVAAIGPKTADAVRKKGMKVELVPEDYSSAGLVNELGDEVEGRKVEVARSNHGTAELLDGLNDAGAYVHETVLYHLEKPDGAGEPTVDALRNGELDAVLFTSSLTVENLIETAAGLGNLKDVGSEEELLDDVVVGVIGEPTRRTAENLGIQVNYVAPQETFLSMARELDNHL
ncbi:MAG: uroporphyrinogen-III synthase [Halobacteria archaeon]